MFTENLRSWVRMLKEGEIFFAKEAYTDYFQDMDETTFYQLLARLYKAKLLGKLDKGLYYRPYTSDASLEPSEEDLLNFFTKNNKNGMLVGSFMLKKMGIIAEATKPYRIYTNALEIKSERKIRGIVLKTVNIDFKNEANLKSLVMLELIEEIDKYTDIDYNRLYNFLVMFAHSYNQEALVNVLHAKSYKKRDIAVIYDVLTHFNIPNTLAKLLNKASRYEKCQAIEKIINNKF